MPNYLYNGVELPALPEYDQSVYPYALLFGTSTYVYLFVSDYPLVFVPERWNNYTTDLKTGSQETKYRSSELDLYNGMTAFPNISANRVKEANSWILGNTKYDPIWANYTMYDVNGGVAMEPSEPIPVGGKPEPEPDTPEPDTPEPDTPSASNIRIFNPSYIGSTVCKTDGPSTKNSP